MPSALPRNQLNRLAPDFAAAGIRVEVFVSVVLLGLCQRLLRTHNWSFRSSRIAIRLGIGDVDVQRRLILVR